jgi:dienelactone hydrolase
MKQLVMILCISLAIISNARGLEAINFLSEPGPHSPFRLKRAKADGVTLDPKEKIELTGFLGKPVSNTPAAAVILLHSGPGLQDFHKTWAEQLAAWGYVSLLIYSEAPAGINVPSSINLSGDIISNTYGAYEYLIKQPYVDPDHIGVMGWSAGGIQSLNLIGAEPPPGRNVKKTFAAAAIFYPVCNPDGGSFTVPMLILLGDSDGLIQKGHCQLFKQSTEHKNPQQVVKLKVYPGATHFYDDPVYPAYSSTAESTERSAYYYDSEAHQDSLTQVRQFFQKYLGEPK